MKPTKRRLALVFAFVGISVALFFQMPGGQEVSESMTEITNTEWAQNYEIFPEDLEEIQRIWDAPLPEDLQYLGGMDWPAWGRFSIEQRGQDLVVVGEVRDRKHWYAGDYRLVNTDGDGIDLPAFVDFEVAGLDGHKVILHRRNAEPPIDVLYLYPVQLENLRTR